MAEEKQEEQDKRPSRSVFRDLFFSMVAFGVLVGLTIPLLAKILLDNEQALNPAFSITSATAGFVIGLVNFIIFKILVSRELTRLVTAMNQVLLGVASAEKEGAKPDEGWVLDVTSDDAVGHIERSFNDMTHAIARRLHHNNLIQTLHSRMAASVRLEEVAEVFQEAIHDVLGATGSLLYAEKGGALELLTVYGFDRHPDLPQRLSTSSGPVRLALESAGIVSIVPERDGLEWLQLSTPLGKLTPTSVLLIPLMEQQEPVGLIAAACNVDALTRDQRRLLEVLCREGAPYLYNAVLHRKVNQLAVLDDLTGLLDKRFGLRRLKEELSRAARSGKPLSVLLLDLDHFHELNESRGPEVGDLVLQQVGTTLENQLRFADVVCRYGGEEFMVLAPETGRQAAYTVAERLRVSVEKMPISWGDQEVHVTASIGVSTGPGENLDDPDALVDAALQALEAAKNSGRNKVVFHTGEDVLADAETLGEAKPLPADNPAQAWR